MSSSGPSQEIRVKFKILRECGFATEEIPETEEEFKRIVAKIEKESEDSRKRAEIAVLLFMSKINGTIKQSVLHALAESGLPAPDDTKLEEARRIMADPSGLFKCALGCSSISLCLNCIMRKELHLLPGEEKAK